MEMTPSRVIAPVGTQIPFTCKYRSQSSADLYITVESLNSHYYNETRYLGGAQMTFYHVVGCNRQTIRCILSDRYGQQVGVINVFVYPGLRRIRSQYKKKGLLWYIYVLIVFGCRKHLSIHFRRLCLRSTTLVSL